MVFLISYWSISIAVSSNSCFLKELDFGYTFNYWNIIFGELRVWSLFWSTLVKLALWHFIGELINYWWFWAILLLPWLLWDLCYSICFFYEGLALFWSIFSSCPIACIKLEYLLFYLGLSPSHIFWSTWESTWLYSCDPLKLFASISEFSRKGLPGFLCYECFDEAFDFFEASGLNSWSNRYFYELWEPEGSICYL